MDVDQLDRVCRDIVAGVACDLIGEGPESSWRRQDWRDAPLPIVPIAHVDGVPYRLLDDLWDTAYHHPADENRWRDTLIGIRGALVRLELSSPVFEAFMGDPAVGVWLTGGRWPYDM